MSALRKECRDWCYTATRTDFRPRLSLGDGLAARNPAIIATSSYTSTRRTWGYIRTVRWCSAEFKRTTKDFICARRWTESAPGSAKSYTWRWTVRRLRWHFKFHSLIVLGDYSATVPAHFVEKHRNQTARLGSSASLRCEAKGDHPLKILWKKAGSHLEQKLSDYRYTLKEENTTDGSISTLEFISTSREDSGRYFCIASNAYGRDEMTIHLYIQGNLSYKFPAKRARKTIATISPCQRIIYDILGNDSDKSEKIKEFLGFLERP